MLDILDMLDMPEYAGMLVWKWEPGKQCQTPQYKLQRLSKNLTMPVLA